MAHRLQPARKRWHNHRCSARDRDIEHDISFEDWYEWWISNGVDKSQSQGPMTANTLCMCRKGDVGPYSLDNIYCATLSQNNRDQHIYNPLTGTANPMFGRTGAAHNGSRPVGTPLGDFPSVTAAAAAHGLDPANIRYRMKKWPQEYYYL